MDKTFYVDLVSNASMDVYPRNTLAAFTNVMSSPIELDEPYEVALNEIIYPLDFSQSINIEYQYVCVQLKPKLKMDFVGPRLEFKYSGNMKINDIITAFARVNDDNISQINFMADKEKVDLILKPRLGYDEESDRVTAQAGLLSDNRTVILYFRDDEFLDPLGFDRELFSRFFYREDSIPIHMAGRPPDFTYRSSLLFVNTDIIEGHRVGDSMSMNLRTLPLSKGAFENVQYMSFTNEYFFPVRFSRIDSISIKLTDENGEKIKFRSGRVFITLKFKPKRKNLT